MPDHEQALEEPDYGLLCPTCTEGTLRTKTKHPGVAVCRICNTEWDKSLAEQYWKGQEALRYQAAMSWLQACPRDVTVSTYTHFSGKRRTAVHVRGPRGGFSWGIERDTPLEAIEAAREWYEREVCACHS